MVCGVSLLIGSLLTVATPLATLWPFSAFVYMLVLRTMLGLSQGFTSVAVICLIRDWAPPNGYSRMVAVVIAGVEVGGVIALFFGGILCASSFLGESPLFVVTDLFVRLHVVRRCAVLQTCISHRHT